MTRRLHARWLDGRDLHGARRPVQPTRRAAPPSHPQAIVSIDAVDASGRHQLEILHDVFKHRLDVRRQRLCASARLVVEAYVSGDAATVIARAMATLDKAALIIRTKLP